MTSIYYPNMVTSSISVFSAMFNLSLSDSKYFSPPPSIEIPSANVHVWINRESSALMIVCAFLFPHVLVRHFSSFEEPISRRQNDWFTRNSSRLLDTRILKADKTLPLQTFLIPTKIQSRHQNKQNSQSPSPSSQALLDLQPTHPTRFKNPKCENVHLGLRRLRPSTTKPYFIISQSYTISKVCFPKAQAP